MPKERLATPEQMALIEDLYSKLEFEGPVSEFNIPILTISMTLYFNLIRAGVLSLQHFAPEAAKYTDALCHEYVPNCTDRTSPFLVMASTLLAVIPIIHDNSMSLVVSLRKQFSKAAWYDGVLTHAKAQSKIVELETNLKYAFSTKNAISQALYTCIYLFLASFLIDDDSFNIAGFTMTVATIAQIFTSCFDYLKPKVSPLEQRMRAGLMSRVNMLKQVAGLFLEDKPVFKQGQSLDESVINLKVASYQHLKANIVARLLAKALKKINVKIKSVEGQQIVVYGDTYYEHNILDTLAACQQIVVDVVKNNLQCRDLLNQLRVLTRLLDIEVRCLNQLEQAVILKAHLIVPESIKIDTISVLVKQLFTGAQLKIIDDNKLFFTHDKSSHYASVEKSISAFKSRLPAPRQILQRIDEKSAATEENVLVSQAKEKIKTRGVADPARAAAVNEAVPDVRQARETVTSGKYLGKVIYPIQSKDNNHHVWFGIWAVAEALQPQVANKFLRILQKGEEAGVRFGGQGVIRAKDGSPAKLKALGLFSNMRIAATNTFPLPDKRIIHVFDKFIPNHNQQSR